MELYRSPIDMVELPADFDIVKEVAHRVGEEIDNEIIMSVRKVGIVVDKDELLKALTYDRDQYVKGYADAKAECDWIPCSERLPEEPYPCIVTIWDDDPRTGEPYEKVLDYFIGYDGDRWNEEDGLQCPYEVIAWIKAPEAYKENDYDID